MEQMPGFLKKAMDTQTPKFFDVVRFGGQAPTAARVAWRPLLALIAPPNNSKWHHIYQYGPECHRRCDISPIALCLSAELPEDWLFASHVDGTCQ